MWKDEPSEKPFSEPPLKKGLPDLKDRAWTSKAPDKAVAAAPRKRWLIHSSDIEAEISSGRLGQVWQGIWKK